MKRTIKEDINDIKRFTSVMPKTLNESLGFSESVPMQEMEEPVEEPMPEQPAEMNQQEPPMAPPQEENVVGMNPASEKAKQLIDNIRKMSLRAMAELADTPEDENYIMLKKV